MTIERRAAAVRASGATVTSFLPEDLPAIVSVPGVAMAIPETELSALVRFGHEDLMITAVDTGARILGQRSFRHAIVRVKPGADLSVVQAGLRTLLIHRHGTEDFNTRNMADTIETANETQNTLTYLLAAIALISLIVGGIGGGLSTSAIVGWRVLSTVAPIVLAFACAFLTGIVFGYLPARKAVHLEPIDALARE